MPKRNPLPRKARVFSRFPTNEYCNRPAECFCPRCDPDLHEGIFWDALFFEKEADEENRLNEMSIGNAVGGVMKEILRRQRIYNHAEKLIAELRSRGYKVAMCCGSLAIEPIGKLIIESPEIFDIVFRLPFRQTLEDVIFNEPVPTLQGKESHAPG